MSEKQDKVLELSPSWEFVSDQVMGGVSEGKVTAECVDGRPAARLTGRVSLENNGGFLQMAFDLAPGGAVFDASGWQGIEIDLCGNSERYDLRLRTADLTRPWQSYRVSVHAAEHWQSLRLPFAEFQPHRTDVAFDPARLRRIGLLGIGRVFEADVAVAGLRFFR